LNTGNSGQLDRKGDEAYGGATGFNPWGSKSEALCLRKEVDVKQLAIWVSLVLLAGCVGKVYTVVDPKPDSQGRIEGVLMYQPRTLVMEFETTHLQDEKGKIVGSAADGMCEPIPSYEIIYAPDYGKKYAILYDAALFETKKFSLEVDRGVLIKLNNESTSVAKEALDFAKGIIAAGKEIAVSTIKGVAPPEGKRPCNAGKSKVRLRNIEEILKEDSSK
jgi:hypothetical protein